MKKSVFILLLVMGMSLMTSMLVSCDPNQGEEDVYIIPEDDGPESTLEENREVDGY